MVASLVLLALAIYVVQTNKNMDDFFIFGYKPVFVLSGSMEPTLKTNGVAIAQKVPFDEIQQGDIIMFKKDNLIISHRVVKIDSNGDITTKGDNNSSIDNFIVTQKDIKGKIVLILNWVAPIVNYCKQPGGIIKVTIYAVAFVVLLQIIKIAMKHLFLKKNISTEADKIASKENDLPQNTN